MSLENEKLVKFWNDAFNFNGEVEAINGKWVEDETFNNVISKYINSESIVLDFGSGTGWGLIEVYYTTHFKSGIGMDTSINGVNYSNEVANKSNIKNIRYIAGNESLLNNYPAAFDAIISINVIDVLPDEIIDSILEKLNYSLKDNGHAIICINPDFPLDFLASVGYKVKDNGIYKDDILRGNIKNKEEWISLFTKHFEFISYETFALVEREKTYPRQMFVLKKK